MPPSQVELALQKFSSSTDATSDFSLLLSELPSLSLSSPETQVDDYKAVLANILTSSSLSIVTTRQLLGQFISAIGQVTDLPTRIQIASSSLQQLQEQAGLTHIDQVVTLTELLATTYEAQEEYLQAARVLQSITIESATKFHSDPENTAALWIRIARNYLEVDDTTAAATFVNKLKSFVHLVANVELVLHFHLSQARILDATRDFLTASSRYYEVSHARIVAEEDRLHTLSKAIICAVLAPAGPQRNRMLARLCQDDRTVSLPEHTMLEKMFFNRLIDAAEVESFSKRLRPHQLAQTADGSTVWAKAVVEHNLLATSLVYHNIDFTHLAELLGLSAGEEGALKAEGLTSQMIEQGRMLGRIDQVEGRVWFERGEATGATVARGATIDTQKTIRQWDANIQHIGEAIERVSNAIRSQASNTQ